MRKRSKKTWRVLGYLAASESNRQVSYEIGCKGTSNVKERMTECEPYSWAGQFNDLDPDDKLAVANLVLDGGAVVGTLDQVCARLKKVKILAMLRERKSDRIVGIAALKTPDRGYRLDKFADAGVAIGRFKNAPELGYVVVSDEMRGKRFSGRLVELIVKEISEPTFATTDNDIMKNNLLRSGFSKAGSGWQGQKGELSLWTFAPRQELDGK